MNESVKTALHEAGEYLDRASGDYGTEAERAHNTRRALAKLIRAVELLAQEDARPEGAETWTCPGCGDAWPEGEACQNCRQVYCSQCGKAFAEMLPGIADPVDYICEGCRTNNDPPEFPHGEFDNGAHWKGEG